jgi:hypothetical protein
MELLDALRSTGAVRELTDEPVADESLASSRRARVEEVVRVAHLDGPGFGAA